MQKHNRQTRLDEFGFWQGLTLEIDSMFMPNPDTKDVVLNALLHRCSNHIYSKPQTHIIFGLKLGHSSKCSDGLSHNFETKEKQYGQTLIITYYCKFCGFAQAEVIPNVPEKKVVRVEWVNRW